MDSTTSEVSPIILEPMQTREEFFEELDTIQKDVEKNGGTPLEEVKKMFGL